MTTTFLTGSEVVEKSQRLMTVHPLSNRKQLRANQLPSPTIELRASCRGMFTDLASCWYCSCAIHSSHICERRQRAMVPGLQHSKLATLQESFWSATRKHRGCTVTVKACISSYSIRRQMSNLRIYLLLNNDDVDAVITLTALPISRRLSTVRTVFLLTGVYGPGPLKHLRTVRMDLTETQSFQATCTTLYTTV